MAEPQRGQLEPEAWQVVPQFEQVESTGAQHPLVGLVPGQGMVWLLNILPVAPPTLSNAQLDCGNSGSEKNSSQTASANSSQGGTSQKP